MLCENNIRNVPLQMYIIAIIAEKVMERNVKYALLCTQINTPLHKEEIYFTSVNCTSGQVFPNVTLILHSRGL